MLRRPCTIMAMTKDNSPTKTTSLSHYNNHTADSKIESRYNKGWLSSLVCCYLDVRRAWQSLGDVVAVVVNTHTHIQLHLIASLPCNELPYDRTASHHESM